MEGRDFDYRREGWQHSATSRSALSSSGLGRRQSWPVWLAHRFLEAIMVATCLVVAAASFFAAVEEASNEGSDLAYSNSMSFMTGGFLALVAAMTRFGWLLFLSLLPSLWALASQDYYNGSGSLADLTYFFDGFVVLIAVGVVVANCRQAQSQAHAYEEEDGRSPAGTGPSRRTPMIKEIV
jgi:hypothetical protein